MGGASESPQAPQGEWDGEGVSSTKDRGVSPTRQQALERMLHDLDDLVWAIRATVAELREDKEETKA